MNNVLLVRFGGLGDLLVALPSIRLVRWKYPDAHLALACREIYGKLLLEAGVVDEIIPEDSPRLMPLFADEPATGASFSGGLGNFGLVFSWTHGGRGDFAKPGVMRYGMKGEVHFLNADPQGPSQLSRQFFRKTAEAIGVSGDLPIEEYAWLPSVWSKPGRLSRRIVIHPGSGSESKRWPLENFLGIIRRLGDRGVCGSLVTGEAEERMEAELEKRVLPPGWEWAKQPDLEDLASDLANAGLYVGNDSGVTHLAAASGAEVIAVFRQDLLTAWRPLGRVHALAASSLLEISLQSVWEILVSRLTNFSADRQNS